MELFKTRKCNSFASVFSWLVDGYWPADGSDDLPGTVHGARHAYSLENRLAVGDVAELYLACLESDAETENRFLVKVSRVADGKPVLDNERRTLARLLTAAGDTTYRHYLPSLVEAFPAADRPEQGVNVFHYEPGLHTLEQVHAQCPALDGRHLGWIFKRLLTVLGFSYRHGAIHAAVLPCHVLLHAPTHGLRLVGWGQSVPAGHPIQFVPTRYRDWYPLDELNGQPAGPATDVFLAARCMVYLAGGDTVTNAMPDSVPQLMQRYIATCLFESPQMRPNDHWALLDDFDKLLRQLYGSPKFHPLTLT
jgi:hypothetical protein